MPYHTIAVHLDDVDKAPDLLSFANKLADKHNSHLIGLFIMPPLELYVARISEASFSNNFSDIINKDQLDRMSKLKALFNAQTSNQNFESEWRFIDNKNDSVFDVLMKQAATTDLLVLGNDGPTSKRKSENDVLIEKVLLDSPVPTLVVPNGFQGEAMGQNVIVGWDATTVSRRAISAAMPVLKSAENAWLHSVTGENSEDHFQHSVEIELASMLARHDIKVELSTSAGNSHIAGESLLEEAKLRGADMLVAGAFGHPRIHNIILGSTTKYLLSHSGLPLLMTH